LSLALGAYVFLQVGWMRWFSRNIALSAFRKSNRSKTRRSDPNHGASRKGAANKFIGSVIGFLL
jgi:hypothetical protein